MRYLNLLPFAALTTAFVVPSQQALNELAIEKDHRQAYVVDKAPWSKDSIVDELKSHYEDVSSTVEDTATEVSNDVKNILDDALSHATETGNDVNSRIHETAFDAQAWLDSAFDNVEDAFEEHEDSPIREPHRGPHKGSDHAHGPPKDGDHHHGPPKDGDHHHGPPKDGDHHHGPPKDGDHHHGPPKDGNHTHRPFHPPHHHKPNLTVYELIAKSKYTTKLAKLINDFPDLVEALNGTEANYTVFAPTDKAFEKIPEHAPKPSKEQLKALLTYHVSPEFFPAGRVLATHTIPTLLKGEHLASEKEPQRLSVNIGLRGLTLNFYSRVVAIDIFGTNGVIHGIDSILLPPPSVIKIIDLLPTEFSTLELGLGKTGLLEELNSTHHPGGTFFAPSNAAFAKLGPKINAFLFSTYGQKYLKALLQYHVVPGVTLYSDAIYTAKDDSTTTTAIGGPTKGYFHIDLPTFLENRSLAVDVTRWGAWISIKINGFTLVTVQDGIAEDGVIQVVGDVLIPPKKLGGLSERVKSWWAAGAEMSVDEFRARFEPLVVDA